MNTSIALLTGAALISCLWLPVTILVFRRYVRKVVTIMKRKDKERERKEWEGLLHKLNHYGPSAEGSSAQGLQYLVVWELDRNIKSLREKYEDKDWDTLEIIGKLTDTKEQEATMVFHKIATLLETWRNILREYEHKQNDNNT